MYTCSAGPSQSKSTFCFRIHVTSGFNVFGWTDQKMMTQKAELQFKTQKIVQVFTCQISRKWNQNCGRDSALVFQTNLAAVTSELCYWADKQTRTDFNTDRPTHRCTHRQTTRYIRTPTIRIHSANTLHKNKDDDKYHFYHFILL